MHVIDTVENKLARGERLTEADALALYETPELVEIGRLADTVNRSKNHDQVFFNVNRHINPTNICALSCKFCAYSRKPGEEGAYAYSIDEMVKKAGEALTHGATEVHMVGGLHPRWNFQYYKDMIAAVKTAHPSLHIKAFTAVEFDWLARKSRKTVRQVMEELMAVGLGSIPGGGAEIFAPEVRDVICDTKVSAEQWLDTHRTAHSLGMKSNSTMLYGHIESYEHRVDHMRRLRELQDETRGFNAFIPLSFQPFQNEMGIDRYTFGYDDLKTLAIARLFLDNFQHIKAYWIMLGQDVAQLALHYGANDLDGTVIEEKISRMAGGRAGMTMNRGFIEKLIKKADRVPVERDTLYRALSTPSPASSVPRQGAVAGQPTIGHAVEQTRESLVALAENASLADVAKLAQQHTPRAGEMNASVVPVVTVPMTAMATPAEAVTFIQSRIDTCRKTYNLTPTQITLDLTGSDEGEDCDLGLVLSIVFAVRHTFADFEVALAGLRALWRTAQGAGAEIDELLAKLAESGIDSVESSGSEGETDLTHGEVVDIHRHIHEAGLPTIAKAELAAPGDGSGGPLWDSFIRRILALGDLTDATGGGSELMGLSIEVSPGSLVTTVEYMRAIAIARLAAPHVPLIIAPLSRIPTISPAQGLGTATYQHPAEKIAALCLHYGAGDLGSIDVERLSPVAVMRQIRSAGFTPVLRDRQQIRSNHRHLDEMLANVIGDTRHVPPSTMKLV